MADEGHLAQVFLNLINNALQAMPEGGTLTVATRAIKTKGTKQAVEISFADTGLGIPEKDLPRIFNPFFSIREGGTGLGLSIVHKIIENHKGEISVRSHPDKGTTFTIRLPAA